MKRNINIISDNYRPKVNDFDPVHISNLDAVVECSVDNIFYGCLEFLEKQTGKNIFDTLISKLRPNGVLTLRFNDLKLLCRQYLENNISNIDLVNSIKNIINPLTIDEIITYLNIASYKVVNISKNNQIISISIMRTSL